MRVKNWRTETIYTLTRYYSVSSQRESNLIHSTQSEICSRATVQLHCLQLHSFKREKTS